MTGTREIRHSVCRYQKFTDNWRSGILLTNEFKEKHPEVEWKVIIGMRHVLVHDYYQISDEMVWATIQTELLPLKEKVELYKRKLE